MAHLRGSSPHTRGARPCLPGFLLVGRIIPAYAGSTRRPRQAAFSTRDHPRVRGEHALRVGRDFEGVGSSPHTRGAQGMLQHAVGHRRIIPAYAGSTCCSLEAASTAWDHPRIRGEHSGVGVPARGPIGSSPHTRGARGMVSSRGWGRRIIPAYAGSTPASPRGSGTNPDHPRIRGEHAIYGEAVHYSPGSSPHTRGAHHARPRHHGRRGIIPAYAGSTGKNPGKE